MEDSGDERLEVVWLSWQSGIRLQKKRTV